MSACGGANYSDDDDDDAFEDCTALTDVIIRDGVKTIGSNAFKGCSSLANVTLPDSLTYIDSFAFSKCNKLKTLDLPDNMKLHWAAFNYCDSVTITYMGDEYNYSNIKDLYKLCK